MAGADANAPGLVAAPDVDRHELLSHSPPSLGSVILQLLVAVSVALSADDHRRLAVPLWSVYIDDSDKTISSPVSLATLKIYGAH